MSERTAVQNPMLRYADAIAWGWLPAMSKSPRWNRKTRCGGVDGGRVSVELQGFQAETELP